MTGRRLRHALTSVLALTFLAACGSSEKPDPGQPDIPTEGLAVNGFLWRAAIETLSFMPMVSANPGAGALISDWYVNPSVEEERMKVSVFILSPRLRADALKVVVVRQQRNAQGIWVNQPIQAATPLEIEDAILTRARQLRIDTLEE